VSFGIFTFLFAFQLTSSLLLLHVNNQVFWLVIRTVDQCSDYAARFNMTAMLEVQLKRLGFFE
jgi:hypothetical protein